MATSVATRAMAGNHLAVIPVWLVRTIAIDARALAFGRIGMALLVLWDLTGRVPDLVAHYTDAGVLPRSARMALRWDYSEAWWMSLHMLSGSAWWQGTLFLIAAFAAVALLVGYRTKLALFVSWLLLLSVQARFPMLTQGGDALLRCLLFWSLFVPLDARWSLGTKSHLGRNCGYMASVGTAALVLQLCMMYLFTAWLKTSPMWRSDFSATYYALHIDHFTSPFGYELLRFPRLLQGLTFATWLLEWIGPLLLFVPIGQRALRVAVPLVFIGFHLGLAASMDLGTFPWICILYWTLLFPPDVWNALDRVIATARHVMPTINAASESSSVTITGSWLSGAIAAFLIGYVVILNFNRLDDPQAAVGRPPLSWVSKATGLDQLWLMFAPGPYKYGSWIILEGELPDGRLVNLYRPEEPLTDAKPVNVSATYPTQYWRRCMVMAYEFGEPAHQEGLLRYFANRWNATHGVNERILKARLVHMIEPTPPPFEPTPQPVVVERKDLREVTLP